MNKTLLAALSLLLGGALFLFFGKRPKKRQMKIRIRQTAVAQSAPVLTTATQLNAHEPQALPDESAPAENLLDSLEQDGFIHPDTLLPLQYAHGLYRIGFPYPGEDEASLAFRRSLIQDYQLECIKRGYPDPFAKEKFILQDKDLQEEWRREVHLPLLMRYMAKERRSRRPPQSPDPDKTSM